MPCDPTSPRAVTPTNLITCHADMPVTRIRLGRAWLPRYTAEPAAEAARTCCWYCTVVAEAARPC